MVDVLLFVWVKVLVDVDEGSVIVLVCVLVAVLLLLGRVVVFVSVDVGRVNVFVVVDPTGCTANSRKTADITVFILLL